VLVTMWIGKGLCWSQCGSVMDCVGHNKQPKCHKLWSHFDQLPVRLWRNTLQYKIIVSFRILTWCHDFVLHCGLYVAPVLSAKHIFHFSDTFNYHLHLFLTQCLGIIWKPDRTNGMLCSFTPYWVQLSRKF